MSPTEDDLRRALSDGAGDVPDADRIVIAAGEQRARRRSRVLSAAAAVVIVGGIATGGTLLARSGNHTQQDASKTAPGAGAPADAAGGTNAGVSGAGGNGSTSDGSTTYGGARSAGANSAVSAPAPGLSVSCPSHVPDTVVSGGAETTPVGSTGKLFSRPVHNVTVCAFPADQGAANQIQLSGSDATTLTDSLENASRSRPTVACPDYRSADQKTLVIIAMTADGTKLPTVTTTVNEPSCAVVVSNGTAVRYDWSWPSSLGSQLAGLSGTTGGTVRGTGVPVTSGTAPGHVNGSPAH